MSSQGINAKDPNTPQEKHRRSISGPPSPRSTTHDQLNIVKRVACLAASKSPSVSQKQSEHQKVSKEAMKRYANADPVGSACDRSSYSDKCINIIVSNDENDQTFTIHAEHINPRARLFQDATPGTLIHIPDQDPEIFATYVHYLYTNTLAILDSTSSNPTETTHIMAQLYTLAEKLEDVHAQEDFLKALIDEADKTTAGGDAHFPGISVVSIIYEGTVSGSPARKALVDLYTHSDESYTPASVAEGDWPVEFLCDLEASLGALGENRMPGLKFQSSNGEGVELEA